MGGWAFGIRRFVRLQFSLATLFVLMTASAVGTWYWYQLPYRVERAIASPGGFCLAGMSDAQIAALSALPPKFREVRYMRRLPDGQAMAHGPYRLYDLAGNLLRRGNYREGKAHGTFVSYSPAGRKSVEDTFAGGSRSGPHKEWYANGQLELYEEYLNDALHGVKRVWYRHGTLAREEHYRQGKADGAFGCWDGQGGSWVSGAFKDGVADGEWIWLPKGGIVASIHGSWSAGRAHGTWQWKKANGSAYLAAEFRQGRALRMEPNILSPRVLEQLVAESVSEPVTFAEDFTAQKEMDLRTLPSRRFYHLLKLNDRRLQGLSGRLVMPTEFRSEPVAVVYAKLLHQKGLGYDLRRGELMIDSLASIAHWRDRTGVSDLCPDMRSKLQVALETSTDIDVVELPLSNLLEFLSELHSISIRLGRDGHDGEHGPGEDVLVTVDYQSVLLRHALGRLLEAIDHRVRLEGETLVVERQPGR